MIKCEIQRATNASINEHDITKSSKNDKIVDESEIVLKTL